jgi:hypothetical protein
VDRPRTPGARPDQRPERHRLVRRLCGNRPLIARFRAFWGYIVVRVAPDS